MLIYSAKRASGLRSLDFTFWWMFVLMACWLTTRCPVGRLCFPESRHINHAPRGRSDRNGRKRGGIIPVCKLTMFTGAYLLYKIEIKWLIWFLGRWMISESRLLESPSRLRSLQQRKHSAMHPPPLWNWWSPLWWGLAHVPVNRHMETNSWCPTTIVPMSQEMMYVWNGFAIVGKRVDLTKSILTTLEVAEEQLRDDPSERKHIWTCFWFACSSTAFCPGCADPSDYHLDDQCVVQLLKGLCLRQLGYLVQAELCFNQIISRWGQNHKGADNVLVTNSYGCHADHSPDHFRSFYVIGFSFYLFLLTIII